MSANAPTDARLDDAREVRPRSLDVPQECATARGDGGGAGDNGDRMAHTDRAVALVGQVKKGTIWSPPNHLQKPKAGSTKYFWMVYTEDWRSELQRVAGMTNVSTLDSELRSSQYQVSV